MAFIESGRTPSVIVGAVDNLFVSFVLGDVRDADYDLMEAAQESFAKQHPRYFALSIVPVVATSAKSAELATTRGLPLMRRFSKQMGGAVTAITATGVGASVARSFTNAFNALNDTGVTMHVSASVADGVNWICRQPEGRLIQDSKAVIADLTAQLASVSLKKQA